MIAMFWVIVRAATGSFMGRALTMAIAASVTIWGYGKYHQSVGRKQVVIASEKAGKKRNARSDEIRSNIRPSTALQRLRREYADGN